MPTETSIPRRRNNLTEEDIQNIVSALKQHNVECRFERIDPNDLRESVEFYKNVNEALSNSKKTALNTLVKLGVTGICTLLLLGLLVKFGKINLGG